MSARLARSCRASRALKSTPSIQDFPGRGFHQAQDAFADGGLARTRFADQPERLPARDRQADVVHGAHDVLLPSKQTAALHKVLAQVSHLQQDVAHAPSG